MKGIHFFNAILIFRHTFCTDSGLDKVLDNEGHDRVNSVRCRQIAFSFILMVYEQSLLQDRVNFWPGTGYED
jgi:hypothetical protein